MTSRLFRAIVGVGISLGTASAACLGAVNDEAPATADASGVDPGTDAKPPPPQTDGGRPDVADAAIDGHADATVDAPADAPHDAILDAFCDAAWPTTKGNPSGPTCGPVEDCAEAGPAPHCFRLVAPSTCDSKPPSEVAWCVGGTWQCSNGGVSQEQCKCWSGQPCK